MSEDLNQKFMNVVCCTDVPLNPWLLGGLFFNDIEIENQTVEQITYIFSPGSPSDAQTEHLDKISAEEIVEDSAQRSNDQRGIDDLLRL